MHSADKPRDIFGQDNLTEEQLTQYKTKLAWAISNRSRALNKLAATSHPIKALAKYHDKMAAALAEAIRFKTCVPVMDEFGHNWAEKLDDLQLLHDGEL